MGTPRRLPKKKLGNKPRRVEVVVLDRDVGLALLSCFALLDDVFTEDDAFEEHKKKIAFGRFYEEWKRARKVLEPEFEPVPQERPRKWLGEQVRRSKSEAQERPRKPKPTARDTSRRATNSKISSSATKRISAKKPPKAKKREKR